MVKQFSESLIILAFIFILLPIQSLEVTSPILISDAITQTNIRQPSHYMKIYFSYGVGGSSHKNILDTFLGIYTKDMVMDPPITTKIALTFEELKSIEAKLVEIGFFDRSDIRYYTPRNDSALGMTTPYSVYYLKVHVNGTIRELSWNTEYLGKATQDMKNLEDLSHFLMKIIESTPEYKSLPEARGGYC